MKQLCDESNESFVKVNAELEVLHNEVSHDCSSDSFTISFHSVYSEINDRMQRCGNITVLEASHKSPNNNMIITLVDLLQKPMKLAFNSSLAQITTFKHI